MFSKRDADIDSGMPELKEWVRVMEGLRSRVMIKSKL